MFIWKLLHGQILQFSLSVQWASLLTTIAKRHHQRGGGCQRECLWLRRPRGAAIFWLYLKLVVTPLGCRDNAYSSCGRDHRDRAPSLTNERGKGMVVDDYKSDSDIDPEDMRMFEEGFTRVDVRAEGPSRVLEIPSDFNLLEDTVELVPQFDLLCYAAKSESLREINDSALSRDLHDVY
uniref:Uncharacterized protein LOC104239863 n=1 Tax=Nicotiana sylvestris TaxID=4096 RepID=A0A1U7XTD2_NICSY|nr:PREDICTED: uncharacterized protein LOC104239863 [Nicotiana sylvestris]